MFRSRSHPIFACSEKYANHLTHEHLHALICAYIQYMEPFSAFADTVPAGARTDQCAADNIIVRQITSLDYGELHVKNYLVYLIWIRLQVSAEKRKRPSYLRICVGMCMSGLLLRVHTMLLH